MVKLVLAFLLLFPLTGYSQKAKLVTDIKADTLTSCKHKYLFKITNRTLSNSKRTIEVSDFTVLSFDKLHNDTVLAIKGLNEAELKVKFKESEEKDYSERISYELISENILEITISKSHYFEGAAHGEHWYESSFFDLNSKNYFNLSNALREDGYTVLNKYILKDLKQETPNHVDATTLKINHYSFSKEDLVIAFHYLDPDSPIHVSYAQQVVEVYVPYKVLKPYLFEGSPVYKLVAGQECK